MEQKLFIIKTIKTPVGNLITGGSDGIVYLCDWEVNPRLDAHIEEAVKIAGCTSAVQGNSETLILMERELMEYFRGERKEFSVKVFPGGSEFRRMILTATSGIPYGQTVTYKELAGRCCVPRSVRAVATALASNPVSIFIPCHRVIGSDGKLRGYAGSLEAKRFLLALESGYSS